jgi:hypothetical protein
MRNRNCIGLKERRQDQGPAWIVAGFLADPTGRSPVGRWVAVSAGLGELRWD